MSKESESSESKKPIKLMDISTDVLTGVIREFIGNLGVISTSAVSKDYKNHFLQEKHIKKAIKDFFIKGLKSGIKNKLNGITLEITDKMVSFFNSPDVQEYLEDIIEEIKTVELKPSITLQNITHINVTNIKEDLKWLPNFPILTTIVVKNCENLTKLIYPEATNVWVENCEELTEFNCPEATDVKVVDCENLTELNCPEATDVWVVDCEELTELNCPEATDVKVENCNNLHRKTKQEEKSVLMTEEQESDTDTEEQPNTAVGSPVITEAEARSRC